MAEAISEEVREFIVNQNIDYFLQIPEFPEIEINILYARFGVGDSYKKIATHFKKSVYAIKKIISEGIAKIESFFKKTETVTHLPTCDKLPVKIEPLKELDGWIDVKEALPPEDFYVIIAKYSKRPHVDGYVVRIALRNDKYWFDDKDCHLIPPEIGDITHWKHLPKVPIWKK